MGPPFTTAEPSVPGSSVASACAVSGSQPAASNSVSTGVPTGTRRVTGCGTLPPMVTYFSVTGVPFAAADMLYAVSALMTTQPTALGRPVSGTMRPVSS